MHPADIDPQSGCRLPLPDRNALDEPRQRIYDSLADPQGGSLRGLRGPGGISLHSPGLAPRLGPSTTTCATRRGWAAGCARSRS